MNSVNQFQKRRRFKDSLSLSFAGSQGPADGVNLAFRLPDSTKLHYSFHQSDTLMVCTVSIVLYM